MISCFSIAFAFPQTLAEAARKEAERRKALAQQGVEGKVISDQDVRKAQSGNVTISSPAYRPQAGSPAPSSTRGGKSPQPYRTSIKKLEREIGQSEERLTMLRSRAQADRWAITKTGKPARGSSGEATQERLRGEIQLLESKLKRLQSERQEIYDAGRKAGFEPGELEGRGIVP